MNNEGKNEVIAEKIDNFNWITIVIIVLLLAFLIAAILFINDTKKGDTTVSGEGSITNNEEIINKHFTVNMNDYIYAGNISNPSIAENTENYEVVFYYNTTDSTSNGTKWSESNSSKKLDVGTYYMYATLKAEDGNFYTTPTVKFAVNKAEGTLKYKTTTVTKNKGAAVFTNTLTLTGDGSLSYTSSNSQVAEVNNQTGAVTIKDMGDVTITASVADGMNYTYQNKSASYTLKITRPVYYLMGSDSTGDRNFYILGHNRTGCTNEYSPELIQTITIQNTLTAPSNYFATWDVSRLPSWKYILE